MERHLGSLAPALAVAIRAASARDATTHVWATAGPLYVEAIRRSMHDAAALRDRGRTASRLWVEVLGNMVPDQPLFVRSAGR